MAALLRQEETKYCKRRSVDKWAFNERLVVEHVESYKGEKDVQARRSWIPEENKDRSQTTSNSQARQPGSVHLR